MRRSSLSGSVCAAPRARILPGRAPRRRSRLIGARRRCGSGAPPAQLPRGTLRCADSSERSRARGANRRPAMRAEIAIRGGTVVDGSGAAPYRADVAIAGGRVTAIEATLRAPRELDAGGRLVVPGFIDMHTHYDPQVLWDPGLTPSSWHGVTAVVAGNCGYSLAPTRPEGRGTLLRTLDKVEDMRLATLEAGVSWDFESYAEYLGAVARRGTHIHFGGYVGHTPVRIHVMGDEAYERPAREAEIRAMQALVADSIRGGALGFSTDRAGFHLGDGGRPVPSIAATQQETEALMGVTAAIGRGVVHVAPGEDFRWIYDFQRRLGRRLNWSALLTYPPA